MLGNTSQELSANSEFLKYCIPMWISGIHSFSTEMSQNWCVREFPQTSPSRVTSQAR